MTREEIKKWLENLKEDIGHPRHEALWHYEQSLDEIIQTLTQEPKTGEWITNKDGYSKCSECGFSFGCIVCPHEETDFCPNCGADMRGDKE